MIEILDLKPLITEEQLESLRFQLLTPSHGRLIEQSVLVVCEGSVKALYLKAGEHKPISELAYRAALRGLNLMKFTPANHSRRGSVQQEFVGRDLLGGWIRTLTAVAREDLFRAGNRDNFIPMLWLKPLLDDFEQAMKKHLPEYWRFHMLAAKQLVRPEGDKLKTVCKVKHYYVREGIEQWDEQTKHYFVPGTEAFSTLTLNHNIIFGAHDDGRNVPGTLSCLTALGEYVGGTLCFPRLGISFYVRPGDLLIADTNEEYHGTVDGIIGDRYSVVAYLHGSLLTKKASLSQQPLGGNKREAVGDYKKGEATMSNTSICPKEKSTTYKVRNLTAEEWRAVTKSVKDDPVGFRVVWFRSTLRSTLLCLEADGVAVSYAAITYYSRKPAVNIFAIYTPPACQRKGHGRRFVEEIVNFAREKGLPAVNCTCMSEKSEQLFKSLGFVQTGTTKQGYPIVEKAIGEQAKEVSKAMLREKPLW